MESKTDAETLPEGSDDRPSSAGPTSGGNQPSALFGIGTLIGIGAGIGLIFGTMLGNIALGLGAGAALGTVTGAIVESRRNT